MAWFNILMLCFSAFAIGVTTMGYAIDPVRFPPNWFYVAGWVSFMFAIILWGIKP